MSVCRCVLSSCLHAFKTLLGCPLAPIHCITAMENPPTFKCTKCWKYKTSNDFGTCHRNDQYGLKGQQLSKWFECVAINATSHKRKHAKSDPNTLMEQSTMP